MILMSYRQLTSYNTIFPTRGNLTSSIPTDGVESRSVYIVFSFPRFLNNVMREATLGKLTISIYIKLLYNKLISMLGGRIFPSKCLKGCSLGTLKQEKGLGLFWDILKIWL